MSTHSTLLLTTLELAVPLHILEIRDWTPEERIAFTRAHADTLASKGDVLQFGGRKGEAAALFNITARCLACLAYQPGGVRFCGVRWEA